MCSKFTTKLLKSVIRSQTKWTKMTNNQSATRALATTHDSFRVEDLIIREAVGSERRSKPDEKDLKFGHNFSDHMLEVEWNEISGWSKPVISPLHNLSLHPAAKCLHYATELFEGIKAFRGLDNHIRIFRPDMNMKRMARTVERTCLPAFDTTQLLACMSELIRLDRDWVPSSTRSALYIRPTMIGCDPTLGVSYSKKAMLYVLLGPVGAYFPTGFKPITLYADPVYVRAAPGGAGAYKMGSNYAPTILISKRASDEHGAQQVLWLYGPDERLTEVGTMNIFAYLTNEKGEKELVTPPLEDGLILPGVTRDSLLSLARDGFHARDGFGSFKVSERYITMGELVKAVEEKRMHEMFGAGTACVVCPIEKIVYRTNNALRTLHIPTMAQQPCIMQKFFDTITSIQYGEIQRPDWMHLVS